MAGEQAVPAMAALNAAQCSAVTTPAHAILQILAGPGSGKTNVLTHRVCFLLEQGMKPENIILTTFTNVTNTPSELVDK
jgi:DNA helicase-2/ATP-dependent DNA helicase PcrA